MLGFVVDLVDLMLPGAETVLKPISHPDPQIMDIGDRLHFLREQIESEPMHARAKGKEGASVQPSPNPGTLPGIQSSPAKRMEGAM